MTTNFSVLDIEQVLFIHEAIITQAGGVHGVRDFELLHSGLERCKATFAGEDLYPTLFTKAGALLHSLVMNHAFLDGNKRTAYAIMVRFLNANAVEVTATQKQIVKMCLAVDNEGWRVNNVLEWLNKHTTWLEEQN